MQGTKQFIEAIRIKITERIIFIAVSQKYEYTVLNIVPISLKRSLVGVFKYKWADPLFGGNPDNNILV